MPTQSVSESPVVKYKKRDAVLKEFSRQLPDDDIRFVCFKLAERKSGDVGDVVEFLQQDVEIDRVLASARGADELYDLLDELYDYLDREWKRRSGANYS